MVCLARLLAHGFILACSLLAVAPAVAVAGDAPSFDEEAVESEVHRSFAALVKAARSLEADEYLSFFDRDRFTALNADGTVVHSFDEFEQAIRENFAALEVYESLDFDRVKVTVLDADTAILVNEYRAVVRLASGPSVTAAGGGTQVWHRTGAGWRLVSVSSSARPDPAL